MPEQSNNLHAPHDMVFHLAACGKLDYGLYNLVPAFTWLLFTVLGEMRKFVPMSPKRFKSIATWGTSAGFLNATVVGSPQEEVAIACAQQDETGGTFKLFSTSCVIPEGQTQCTMHHDTSGSGGLSLFV